MVVLAHQCPRVTSLATRPRVPYVGRHDLCPGDSMSPVLRLAVHKLRAAWRGWAVLALLTAIAGAAVVVAAVGAIRTDTAYPRFLAASHAADALASPAGDGASGYDAALGTLPGVAADAPVVGINAAVTGAGGKLDSALNVVAALDGNLGHTVGVPRLLAGRLPAPDAPGEVAVDRNAVSQLHVHVGSVLPLLALPSDPAQPVPSSRRFSVRVTGIFITTDSVVPVNVLAQVARVLATPALYRELGLGGYRRRPDHRHPARRRVRALGLAGIRLPGRPVRRRGHPAPGAVADPGRARRHRPGCAARRPPGSRPPRHGHPPHRVTPRTE